MFKQIVDKYGMSYLQDLVRQNVTWVRGRHEPIERVTNQEFVATFTAGSSMIPAPGVPRFIVPNIDNFAVWAQRAAIMRGGKHPETAKLYLNWFVQSTLNKPVTDSFSIRDDVPPPAGYRSLWRYPNAVPTKLEEFLANPSGVAEFRRKVTAIVGPVIGLNPCDPSNILGSYPTRAI